MTLTTQIIQRGPYRSPFVCYDEERELERHNHTAEIMRCIITFDSIHRVMKAEKILKRENVSITLIPTPRRISSDCGMVVQVDCDEIEYARECISKKGLVIEGVYEIDEEVVRRYEKKQEGLKGETKT